MSMQEVREQNIALVTQTALACFVENGIEKTTIRDIAQHAGLTERSVYRYFAGWMRRSRCATPAGSTRSSTARRSALRSPPGRSPRPSAAGSPTGRSIPRPM